MTGHFDIKPHVAAKHAILEQYLKRWFPILRRGKTLAYIDGFAGPGIYSKNERGSPIIALETANRYTNPQSLNAHFWFIEENKKHVAKLEHQIKKLNLNKGIHINDIKNSIFEKEFPTIVDSLKTTYGMPPTFVFADPWGYSYVKMCDIVNFLQNPKCEVLLTFMSGPLTRFSGLPGEVRQQKLNALFGTSNWKQSDKLKGDEKTKFFLNLYISQLRHNNIKFVHTFELCDERNCTIYHLIFATNHETGLETMKKAMVCVDPKFTFRVSDAIDPSQTFMFKYSNKHEWYKYAAVLIFQHFHDQTVPMYQIKRYVLTETPYIYHRGILSLMKKSGQIISIDPLQTDKHVHNNLKYNVRFSSKKIPLQTRLF